MANLIPELIPNTFGNGLLCELEVLDKLKSSLSDDHDIFHSVPWHSMHHDRDTHGEIDIVVLGPSGTLLLVEIKAGAVTIENGLMIKHYKEGHKNVGQQISTLRGAMLTRLQQAGLKTYVNVCLVLPHHRVGDQHVIAIGPERIIDSTRYEQLGTIVRQILSNQQSSVDMDALRHFLSNRFKVSLDMRALGEQVRASSTRLADGLATWVPRMMSPSGAIQIQATAGSGKTQLAMRLLQDSAASKQRSLYVCYNRTLADHMVRLAPTRTNVSTFHELCLQRYRDENGEPDFSDPTFYDRLSAHYCQATESDPAIVQTYDLIVIDEGQDFKPDWVQALVSQLTSDGRIYLLEDHDQRLYDREAFTLTDAVSVRCDDNFRSPRQIVNVINAFGLTEYAVEPRSPYDGDLPSFYTYTTESTLLKQTESAVQALLDQGLALSDIAIITWHGLQSSLLLNTSSLGDIKLRRPTGKYSPAGDALWTEGDVLTESVFRFKGQSKAGIVLTEVDYDSLKAINLRKLFVGFTRAQMALAVVLSERADALLRQRLEQEY